MDVSHRPWAGIPTGRLDVRLAGLGLLLASLLLPLRLFTTNVLVETVPLVLAAGCALYVVGTRPTVQRGALPTLPRGLQDFLPGLVVVGAAGLLVAVWLAGERTLLFYGLASVLGAGVLLQVFFTDERELSPPVVLAEIVILALVIRFSALYSVAGYIGVDAWLHVPVWAAGIAETGTLAPLAGVYYLTAPFYHVFLAVAAGLLDTTLRNALFLTLGTVMALTTVLVFAVARFFVTARWALAAAAMTAVADEFIRWSIHLIPESLGVVFFLGVLYGLTRMAHTGHDRRSTALTLGFGLAVVFTHQLSTFIVLTLLGVAAAVQLLVRRFGDEDRLTVVGVFGVVLVVTLATWSNTPYGGTSFLVRMTEGITRTIITQVGFVGAGGGTTGGGAPAGGGTLGWVVPYVEVLGLLLLLFVTVLGSLALVDENPRTSVTLTYLGVIAVMLGVTLVLPLVNVRSFLPGRWLAFLYAPMMVVGVLGLSRLSERSTGAIAAVVLVLFAASFPGAMVIADKATLDSPVFEDRQARFSYTQSELAAVRTVDEILPPDRVGAVYTDHPYRTLFRRLDGFPARIVQVDDRGAVVSPGPVIYRTYQSEGGAVIRTLQDEPNQGTHLVVPAASLCPDRHHTVYANGDVRVCLPREEA